jgi:lipoprotein signal peptidase
MTDLDKLVYVALNSVTFAVYHGKIALVINGMNTGLSPAQTISWTETFTTNISIRREGASWSSVRDGTSSKTTIAFITVGGLA